MPKRRHRSPKPPEQDAPDMPGIAVVATADEAPSRTDDSGKSALAIQWRGVYALFPVFIALISSVNSLSNYFAADDLQQVLSNTFIKKLGNLPAAFTSSVWSFTAGDIVFTVDPYYRPVFSMLLTLNYALFGTNPLGWHLVNVLVHAGVTLLVFVVVREITERNWVSLLTAALFAVHPAHAESVAWVSGITDPLMALLLLPSFYFYLRFRRQGRNYVLVCALAFFLLALFAKETAAALPIVVAYCELFYFRVDESLRKRLLRSARLLALFVIPAALYFLMRQQALGTFLLSGEPRYPLIPSLLTVPLAVVKYLGLMLIPWGYSYQHYLDLVETALSPRFLAPLVLLIATGVGLTLVKSRELRLGAIWFITLLAPALAAIRQFDPAYLLQERYLYAPSFGVCLGIAIGLERLAASSWFGSRGRAVAVALATLLFLVWGAVFIRQNRVWDDTVSVYRNAVEVSPRSPLARVLLSRSYYDAGRPREAEAAALAALELDPRCAPAYLNLSYYARMSGKLDKACEYLENGISAVPERIMTRSDLATMYLNLGLLYGQRKMFEIGQQKLLHSIEISPRPVAWYYAGQFYSDQGRFEEARVMYEQTLIHVPRWFSPIHLRLGMTYEALGDTSRAKAEYERYLELAPPESPDRESVSKHLTALKGGPPPKQVRD